MNDSAKAIPAEDASPSQAAFWSDVSLLSVAVIWGINIPIMKTGLDQIDVFAFNAIRLAISAAVLMLFAWRELRQGLLPKTGITWRQVFWYALMTCAVYQLLFLLGIARTTSGNTALIMATVPMWTALLARVFIGETIQRLAWWGLCLAMVGTAIVAIQKGNLSVGRDHLWGNLIVLLAALVWSAGTVYSRPLLKQISPLQLSALAAAIGLPVHLLAAMGSYKASWPVLQTANIWWIMLFSGVLSSGLALPMWSLGVRHSGAAHAAVIQNLTPLVAIFAAWLSRGEPATLPQLFGGALILAGLVIMRKGRKIPTG